MEDPILAMLARLKAMLAKQYSLPASRRARYTDIRAQVVREAGYRGEEFTTAIKRLSEAHAADKKERRKKFSSHGTSR